MSRFYCAAFFLTGSTSAMAATACPPVTIIPQTMAIQTRYVVTATDKSYSRLDSAKVASQKNVRAAIVDPVRTINRLADAYRAARTPDGIRCLARHLDAQADANAMMVAPTEFDMYFREWMIASLSISYLKARPAIDRQPESVGIRAWLTRSARDIERFNQAAIGRGVVDNHRYWGALAALAAGLVDNDASLLAFARETRRLGLEQVTAEGTLPAELRRGTKSYHYHLFAFAPLAASMLLDPNRALPAERIGLYRLSSLLIDDAGQPNGKLASLTRVRQEPPEHAVLYSFLRPFIGTSRERVSKLDGLLNGVSPNYLFLGGDTRYLTR